MSPQSLQHILKHKKANSGGVTIESLIERGIIVVGSPDTVRNQIIDYHYHMGFQELVTMLTFGTMPAHLSEKNIRLFAKEVMPALKPLSDREYKGFEPKKVVAAQ
jgi:alkanesulfonate monooxygenase SsuD/methylene tetrahydromethanopterin reductase-like flavin-dependent oxidoreductase (luciferase family)